MVTKVYCDHCGHAAPNAQKYIFGAHNHFFGINDPGHQGIAVLTAQGQLVHQAQAMQNSTGILSQKPTQVFARFGDVDLCDTCQIVWMKRVKALTQASEP